MVGTQAIGVALSNGIGLIIGALTGLMFSSAVFSRSILNEKNRPALNINWRKIFDLAKRYKKIPIYTLTADLTGNLSAQLPTMMIGSIFGLKAAAFYGIANRLVMTPFQMIGQSVGQVFYGQSANNLRTNKQQYKLVKRTVLNLLLIGSIPLFVVAVFAHPLFNLVLGAKWHDAAIFAQILAPWWLASFVAMPVMDLFSVLGSQKYHLYFMSSQLLMRAICLYVGAYQFHSLVETMAVFSCASAVLSAFMVLVLLKKANDFDFQNIDK